MKTTKTALSTLAAMLLSSRIAGAADVNGPPTSQETSLAQPEDSMAEHAAASAERAAVPEEKDPTNWRLGISAGTFGTSTDLAGGSTAGLRGFPSTFYATGLERRLDDAWWLTLQLRASLKRGEDPSWGASSYSVDGQLGVRHVFNPADRFQVSMLGSLGGGRSIHRSRTLAAETPNEVGETTSWTANAEAGMALEYWFADWIALRVASPILTAGHSRASQDGSKSSAWFAELGLMPTFGIQLGF